MTNLIEKLALNNCCKLMHNCQKTHQYSYFVITYNIIQLYILYIRNKLFFIKYILNISECFFI